LRKIGNVETEIRKFITVEEQSAFQFWQYPIEKLIELAISFDKETHQRGGNMLQSVYSKKKVENLNLVNQICESLVIILEIESFWSQRLLPSTSQSVSHNQVSLEKSQ
jgi:hypothetical protein